MQATTKKPKVRKNREFKPAPIHGQFIAGRDGKRAKLLNSQIPLNRVTFQPLSPLHTAVCEVCGHAYAAMMVSWAAGFKTARCDECRSDAIAIAALSFQDESGVNLGWRPVDHTDHSLRSWGIAELPRNMRKFTK